MVIAKLQEAGLAGAWSLGLVFFRCMKSPKEVILCTMFCFFGVSLKFKGTWSFGGVSPLGLLIDFKSTPCWLEMFFGDLG